MDKLIIGSHVRMSAPKYLLNSVEETLSYDANSMMFYTGAPQNTLRSPITKLNVEGMWELWTKNNLEQMVVHAPYIINLANTVDMSKSEFGVKFLIEEIKRVNQIGAKTIVLHPGSHLKQGLEIGLDKVVENLNVVFERTKTCDVSIALETMSGKGSEVCFEFEHLKYIIDNCDYPNRLGICIDTCHIWDAGYDLINKWDEIADKLEFLNLMTFVKVIHLNDSKNDLGSHKDRHENLGFGKIGFPTLLKIAYDSRFRHVAKILETPYVEKKYPPYKEEIRMLKAKNFSSDIFDKYKNI